MFFLILSCPPGERLVPEYAGLISCPLGESKSLGFAGWVHSFRLENAEP